MLNPGPFVLPSAAGADFGALSFIDAALLPVISQILQVELERMGYFLSVMLKIYYYFSTSLLAG